jgi:hypothetical protein
MLSTAIRKQGRFLADMNVYLRICMIIVAFFVLTELGLIWFGTSQQINISTTLTYSGRVRSLTQKLLAESMNDAYANSTQAMKDLPLDLADWTARHDAVKNGNAGLHVLSVRQYPDILPTVSAIEPNYLEMHAAIVDLQHTKNASSLMRDIALINKDSAPVYNAYDLYNTYLRSLTTTYQTEILFFGITLTIVILVTLAISVFAIFRPALARLKKNVIEIADANAATLRQKEELQLVLDETRQNDHNTHLPVLRIGENQFNVQGPRGAYRVEKIKGVFVCECAIFRHNRFCLHVKLARSAEQQAS